MTTKTCPWCAEEVLTAAKKCKHCGEFFTDDAPSVAAIQSPAKRCSICDAKFAYDRELYLHRVNVHRKHDTDTSVPIKSGPPPRGSTQNKQMTCPHCNTKGKVTTRKVKLKKGISGGKATGAIMTGGLSLVATGLSRKEARTEAACRQCGTTWHI